MVFNGAIWCADCYLLRLSNDSSRGYASRREEYRERGNSEYFI